VAHGTTRSSSLLDLVLGPSGYMRIRLVFVSSELGAVALSGN